MYPSQSQQQLVFTPSININNNHDSSSSTRTTSTTHTTTAYRKIDLIILPLMFLCYFLQFLDKILINYANIMNISQDLSFPSPDSFSHMATAFFIGYAIAELPQGYLIQKFPVARVLGVNVVLWGVVMCCTAGVDGFASVTVLRTVLGMLEAVITPGLIVVTAQWYTRDRGTVRTGVWYCGLGIGQTVGGLISWAAQNWGSTKTMASWRIMFLCVGGVNLLVGGLVLVYMPKSLESAGFLSEEEKKAIGEALVMDQSTTTTTTPTTPTTTPGEGEERVFDKNGLKEVFTDLQVWLLVLNTILVVIPSGIITTFSATLIHSFGYNGKEAALLNMPSGLVSVIATLLGTFAIRYRFPRWLAICGLMVPTLIGAALISFSSSSLETTTSTLMTKAGGLAGIYLINFDVAPLALIYALVGANTHGYTKRVSTSAAIAVGFSVGNIIGPQTFRARDAPGYLPAKVTVFGVCVGSVLVTILLRLLYGRRNTERERMGKEATGGGGGGRSGMMMTDVTNVEFRYVY